MVKNCAKISKNDCNQILAKYFKNGSNHKLINFSYEPISGEINGYMSEHLLLKINVENGQKTELRFFAKALSDQESIVEFAKSSNVFEKEVQCYKFFEDVKKEYPDFDTNFAPKFYYSRRDEELIILEDLSNNDYNMSKTLDLDVEHIKLALKATAQFHAGSFIFEEIKSKKLGRKYQLTEDYGKWLEESLYCNNENLLSFQYIRSGLRGLCALTDVFKSNLLTPSEFKTKLWSLLAQVYEDIKPSKKFRNVWSNGDLWTKNVMFKYIDGVPVKCKIFDFQLQRYNPPAHDVLFMIYQSANKKIRKKYFDFLLNYYYENLKNELKIAGYNIDNILSKEEFDLSIKYVFPAIKLTKAIYKTISSASKESFKKIAANPKIYGNITFGDRSEFAVKEFKNVKSYRDILTNLLEDLEDLLTHDGKITVEHCHKMLRQKLNTSEYELIEYKTIPVVETISKLIIKIRLQDTDEIINFVVKDEDFQRFSHGFKFYHKIAPEITAKGVNLLQGCVPECYLALVNNLMVFDDLLINNYTFLNLPKYDYKTVMVVIKKLAALHASGFIFEEKQKIKLEDYYGSTYNECDQSNINKVLTEIKFFPDTKRNEIINRISLKPSLAYRNTICHTNLCSNNIFLKFENNSAVDCILVDFGNFQFKPPAYDLMSFLYLTTDQKFRSEYLREILNFYHAQISNIFENYGIDTDMILPYKEFLVSCKDAKESAIVQAVVYFHDVLGKTKSSSNSEVNKGNAEICAKDQFFKKRLQECIEDLRDVYEN